MNNSCSYVILCKSNWWVIFKILLVSAGHWIWGLNLCSFPESLILGFPIPLQKKVALTPYCFCRGFSQYGSGWSKKLVKALQTPSINTFLPMCISGTRPFSKVKLLKPPSLSFSQDKIPFLPPFMFAGWDCRSGGTGTLSSCRDVCAVAVDTSGTYSFLVKMLGCSCHDADVRWEAVPAPGLLPVLSLK